jgi:hypothetical protein
VTDNRVKSGDGPSSRPLRVWLSLASAILVIASLQRPSFAEDAQPASADLQGQSQSAAEAEKAARARVAAWKIESEADYPRVLDEVSQGTFGELTAARDLQRTLTGYKTLIAAYTEIVDTLFDAYSPHANTFPGWYRDQLKTLMLQRLGDVKKKPARFFRRELQQDDMDRVIHAFHILSLNRYNVIDFNMEPTTLGKEFVKAARSDEQGRFWISLHLAERRLLSDELEWQSFRTKEAFEYESIHMHVGMNAKTLGPRIYRVIDLPTDVNDRRVSHFHIGAAKEAAVDRIRKHALFAAGREGSYAEITQELQGMRTGNYSTVRFLEILNKDLLYLYDAFGLPPNPRSMIRLLDRIYETKGQQRMMMRMSLNNVTGKYKMVMRARAEKRKQEIAAKPLITVDAILRKGATDAYAFLEKALTDEKKLRLVTHLIEEDAVPRVVERFPPDHPRDIEKALRRGYQLIGHPAALRGKYFDAMALVVSFDSERFVKQPPPREAFTALIDGFNAVQNVRDFGRAFTSLQNAEMSFVVRRDANPNPELVESFIGAAVTAIRQESGERGETQKDLDRARTKLAEIDGEIRAAEDDIHAANARIKLANQEAAQAEERANATIAERNQAVEEINQKVLDVERVQHENEVDRSTRRPDGSAISQRELKQHEQRELAARAELQKTEDRLLPYMEAKQEQTTREEAEADAAVERAARELLVAQSAERRGRASIVRENAAFEEESGALGGDQASLDRILDVLNKVIVGFDFMGITPDLVQLGDANAGLNVRLAGLAVLAESAFKSDLDNDSMRSLEAEAQSQNPLTRDFATLAIEFGG